VGEDVSPRVEARNLVKHFPGSSRRETVRAVNCVSLAIEPGSTYGLVGESGSGKSTLVRCLVRLREPTSGEVRFDGQDLGALAPRELRARRRSMQIVFQDPYDAFNPRMTVERLVGEPLKLHTDLSREERRRHVLETLAMVGLEASLAERYPRELSGGQLQRVGISRALVTRPGFLVLDEPTASLDLSVRGEVLALLRRLKDELGLTYLLISHDLATVAEHCDEVAVMYLGTIVERGPGDQLFRDPQHPYTQALLSATLPADPQRRTAPVLLRGEQPSPIDPPPGCVFASRCPLVKDECRTGLPAFRQLGGTREARCVRLDDGSNKVPRVEPIKGRA
jgi:oligopeptide/dipeptide ABC transporter ATP-binding protein